MTSSLFAPKADTTTNNYKDRQTKDKLSKMLYTQKSIQTVESKILR